ncbi:hypothetical protein BDV29DRAFT_175708 [Aspergillus leporis]|uniref:Uncharacterized protein n=1 Tax=Aspergillus leporis TaxID=41062 RepID=A0A5N5X011_9EURO|nr:hypothetical protein BDV29DRAFT_175708 [Aspergillus leporis]
MKFSITLPAIWPWSQIPNLLVRTNRHLHNTVNPFLYRFDAIHGQMSALLWPANHGIVKTAQN